MISLRALARMKVRYQGEDLHIQEGQELSLPEEKAYLLLAKAKGNIVLACGLSPKADRWLLAWKALAELTRGFERPSPRHDPVCERLEACDKFFEQGDWEAFQEAVGQIRKIVSARNE